MEMLVSKAKILTEKMIFCSDEVGSIFQRSILPGDK